MISDFERKKCALLTCVLIVLCDLDKGTGATESAYYKRGIKQRQNTELLNLNSIAVISLISKF